MDNLTIYQPPVIRPITVGRPAMSELSAEAQASELTRRWTPGPGKPFALAAEQASVEAVMVLIGRAEPRGCRRAVPALSSALGAATGTYFAAWAFGAFGGRKSREGRKRSNLWALGLALAAGTTNFVGLWRTNDRNALTGLNLVQPQKVEEAREKINAARVQLAVV